VAPSSEDPKLTRPIRVISLELSNQPDTYAHGTSTYYVDSAVKSKILVLCWAAERWQAYRVWSNCFYLDRHPNNWDYVHRSDYGYHTGNLLSVWRLSERCHEESHWILHDFHQLLSAPVGDGVLLRSYYSCTSYKGFCCYDYKRNNYCLIFTARSLCALRGIATGSRPSVRPSVCLSVTSMYRGRMCWVSSKVITAQRIINLGFSLLGGTTSTIYSKGNTPKFGWNWGGVALLNRKPKISETGQDRTKVMTTEINDLGWPWTAISHSVSKYMQFRS